MTWHLPVVNIPDLLGVRRAALWHSIWLRSRHVHTASTRSSAGPDGSFHRVVARARSPERRLADARRLRADGAAAGPGADDPVARDGQPLERPDRIWCRHRVDRARRSRSRPGDKGRARGQLRSGVSPRRVGFSDARARGAHWRAGARNRARPPAAGPGRVVARDRSTRARSRRDRAASLIGSTPPMQALRSSIDRVAATDFTVLLEGESGVGKELVARQIHESSRRRHGPFVAVNCAALVETLLEAELFGIEERTATGVRGRRGKFEHADGGTLFLDEVSDLSPSAQAKLLRAIQDLSVERVGGAGAHRVDIRVVAATNRSLADHGRAPALSGRPVLPIERSGHPDPGLARTARGRAGAGRALSRRPPIAAPRPAVSRPRWMHWSATTGPAMSGSWSGSSNGRWLSPTTTRSSWTICRRPCAAISRPPFCRRSSATTRFASGRAVTSRLILERCQGNKREACRVLGISYHTLQAYVRLRAPQQAGNAGRHGRRQRDQRRRRGSQETGRPAVCWRSRGGRRLSQSYVGMAGRVPPAEHGKRGRAVQSHCEVTRFQPADVRRDVFGGRDECTPQENVHRVCSVRASGRLGRASSGGPGPRTGRPRSSRRFKRFRIASRRRAVTAGDRGVTYHSLENKATQRDNDASLMRLPSRSAVRTGICRHA